MSRFGTTIGGILAATGAALALSVASPASATSYLKLLSSSMNTTFQANITGDGNVYSNGITFRVQDSTQAGVVAPGAPIYDIFGFCVDVFHNISLGNLGYVYASNQDLNIVNPLPTDFGGHNVSPTQLTKINDLINTGYHLHQNDLLGANFDTQMRLAAIQAAIWKIEVPSKTVGVISANLNGAQFGTYQGYFTDYVAGNYTRQGDANDRFYVISDGRHQSFGVAWPIDGVPEPTTWLMMIMGFGGVGATLRRRRSAALAAA